MKKYFRNFHKIWPRQKSIQYQSKKLMLRTSSNIFYLIMIYHSPAPINSQSHTCADIWFWLCVNRYFGQFYANNSDACEDKKYVPGGCDIGFLACSGCVLPHSWCIASYDNVFLIFDASLSTNKFPAISGFFFDQNKYWKNGAGNLAHSDLLRL